jgi:hypothetical protein
MEDGIESNRTTLYDRLELEKKFLYMYKPNNGIWNDCLLTHNREKARKFSEKNKCIIDVFMLCDIENIYKPFMQLKHL